MVGDVAGQRDQPALVEDRPCDPLTDPPVGVGAEAEAAGGVVVLNGSLKADRALLDQVEQLQAPVLILAGHSHHQAQVGLDQPIAGPLPLMQLLLQPGWTEGFDLGPMVAGSLQPLTQPRTEALPSYPPYASHQQTAIYVR